MSRNGDSARARRASRRHGNPDVVAKAQAQPEPEPNVFSRLPLEAIHVIGFHVLALSGDALFALGRSCKMWAAVTSDNGFWTLAVQSRFGSVAYTPASHLVAPASNAWDRAFYEREIAAGRLAPLPPPPCTAAAPNARAAKYTSAKHEYYKRSEILEFHTTREQEALFEATFRAEGTLVRLERKQRCFNVSIGARGSRVCATAGARGELGECPSHPSPGGCTYTIEKNDSSYQRVQKFEASHATYRVCFALPTIGVHGAAAAPPPYAPLPPNGSHRMLASLHSLDGVARQPRTITTRRQAAALLDAAPGPGSKAHWGSQLALWATRPSDEVSCLGRVVANPCRQGSGAAAGGSAAAGGGNKSAAAAAVHAGLPGTGPAEWDEWSPLMPPAAAQ